MAIAEEDTASRAAAQGGFGRADLPKTPQNPALELEQALCALQERGITLFERDGKLRARPASALTEELRACIAAHHEELALRARAREGSQNSQNSQKDVEWIRARMKAVYGLLREALREGYLGPAQRIGSDVADVIVGVASAGGDVARSCRLASRDGSGNDVAAAALLMTYEGLCRRLGEQGVDPFRRRAAVALLLARAQADAADAADGRFRSLHRMNAYRAPGV